MSDVRNQYGTPRAARITSPGPAIEGIKRSIFGKKKQIIPNLLSFKIRRSPQSRKGIV